MHTLRRQRKSHNNIDQGHDALAPMQVSANPTTHIWKYGDSAEDMEAQLSLLLRAFHSLKRSVSNVVATRFCTHRQIVSNVLQNANRIQHAGYKVVSISGTNTTLLKYKSSDSPIDSATFYSVYYRNYRPGEARATPIYKITRSSVAPNFAKLETTCLHITNEIGEENLVSRVVISDVPMTAKLITSDTQPMNGRCRITIFYR
jgi:hypothetical protein